MMKFMFICVAVMSVMGSAFADKSEKVSFETLPKAVQSTLKSLGATKYLKIEKESDDNEVEYEVKYFAGDALKKVELSEDGKILEFEAKEWEKEMAFDDLPSAVKSAFAKIRSDEVEEVELESMDGIVVYFIEYQDGDEIKEAMFSETGEILFVGDEDDDDGDEDDDDDDDRY